MAGPPNSIGQKIAESNHAPSLMTVEVNGQRLDEARFKSISQTGGVPFPDGPTLRYRIGWREVLTDARYIAEFEVPVERLAAFKADRSFLKIDVNLGPGADVQVTTAQQIALTLNEERRFDEITPEMQTPVVLLETCASRMPAGDRFAAGLSRAITDSERSRARRDQANAASRGAPNSRCGAGR